MAKNVVNRGSGRGAPLKAISADITCLLCRDESLVYLPGIIDCGIDVVLAHASSTSMEEKLALDTFDQLKELKISQSMSRRACCWDNASNESFWGRMKEQIGPTAHLTTQEIMTRVDGRIHYYNTRGQARLGWLTPMEYAAKLAASNRAELGVHLIQYAALAPSTQVWLAPSGE